EEGVGGEAGGGLVVRVPALGGVDEDDVGAVAADEPDEPLPRLGRVLDVPVGEAEVVARGEAEDLGGALRLLQPPLGRPARAQLAAREVDDAGAVALLGEEAHRPARAQLHVVGVGGEGEDVELRHWSVVSGPWSSARSTKAVGGRAAGAP